MRRYFLASSVLIMSMAQAVYAVDVTPDIVFRQHQAPNGAQYDPNSAYRTKMENNHQQALNDHILPDNTVGKLVPDINSIGLDFTFKVG